MLKRFARCASVAMMLSAAACHGDHQKVYADLDDPALMDATFTAPQLQQDVDYLFKRVAELHPDLDARLPSAERETLRLALRGQVREGMDRRAFQRLVGTATEAFRDGHAGVFYPYPEFNRFSAGGGTVFPMTVTSRDGALYVKHDFSPTTPLAAGTRLLAINGVPAQEMLATMARYTRGESQLLREQIAAREFDAPATVRYQSATGEVETQVPALSATAFEAGVEKQEDAGGSNVAYRTLEQDVGYLEVSYFGGDQGDFRSSIDDAIATARKDGVKDLLVDIRNNPGGSTDNVETLLSRLSAQECRLVSGITEKINDTSAGGWFAKGKAGELVNVDYDSTVTPAKETKRFPGKVYLLIGPYTYSAGIVMATAVQDCAVGTLVGEPTAGFANQTGQIYFFDLPNTRIRAFAPTRLLFRPSGDRRVGGVQPEHLLTASGAGQEAMVEQARALAVSRR